MKSFFYLVFILPFILKAQEKQFSISVSKEAVLLGNTIKVEFTIKNVQGSFEGPEFAEFDVLMGPNSSSSYSNINGKVSNTSTYTYIIKPRSEGEFFIENAYIIDKNDKDNGMQTEPFKITVLANPEGIIEEEENSVFGSQMFNFSWPDISTDIFKSDEVESKPQESKPKRKIKKI